MSTQGILHGGPRPPLPGTHELAGAGGAVEPRPSGTPPLKLVAFLVCLAPCVRLAWLAATGGLGANPIEFVTRSTGTWTLVLLIATLALSLLRRLPGLGNLGALGRMLGLYVFFYATLHFLAYVWLDQFFDLGAILRDIAERPFITLGFASFVLLIPLAATSNAGMRNRLGKRWHQLHLLIYPIAIGGVVHYWWLVKKDITQPAIYAAILAVLLAHRLIVWRAKQAAETRGAEKP